MSNPRSGDKVTYDGVDYFAVKNEALAKYHGCSACALNGEAMAHLCGITPCVGATWLTQADYIKHRLTT